MDFAKKKGSDLLCLSWDEARIGKISKKFDLLHFAVVTKSKRKENFINSD